MKVGKIFPTRMGLQLFSVHVKLMKAGLMKHLKILHDAAPFDSTRLFHQGPEVDSSLHTHTVLSSIREVSSQSVFLMSGTPFHK